MRNQAIGTSIVRIMPAGLLELLSPADRDLVLEGSRRFLYPAGAVALFGGSSRLAIIVESGLIRLFVQSADGKQASIDYLHPGDTYAILELLGPPEAVHLQAIEESTVIVLDAATLNRLGTTNLAVAAAAIRVLGEVANHHIRIIAVRSLGSMRERLAFDLLERGCRAQLQGGSLVFSVTHEQLAGSIGSTREVVTRILGDLRSSGVVATSPGRIEVLTAARLTAMVRGVLMSC